MNIIGIPLRWILSVVVALFTLLFVAILEINRFPSDFSKADFYSEVQNPHVIQTPSYH